MVNGENRAKIKESAEKTGEGIKRLTIGFGRGIKGFAESTIDAIVNPNTIPEKIETCFDRAIVQPTLRTVDFIEESSHKVMSETDKAFNDRVKKAQDGAQHLKVVFAHPLQDLNMGSFVVKKHPKSDADNAVIDAALSANFVFSGVPASKRAHLIAAFEPIVVKHGEKIIKEGDVGDYFYVVGTGEITFEIAGKEVGSAGPGSSFGELALLYQAPRAATCVAKTQCGLFRWTRKPLGGSLHSRLKIHTSRLSVF